MEEKKEIKSVVDIIIVKYGQQDMEWNCMASINSFTNHPYKITAFDNYKTKISLTELWNQLIEKSDCEYICLLNSDTIVTENWLNRMMDNFDDETAVLSCSTCYCQSKQKLSEYEKDRLEYKFWDDEMIKKIGRDVWSKYGNELVELAQPSGFCYLLKKSIWNKVGRFDERIPSYGNESEFNHRLEQNGYKLKYIKGVYVHHFGGMSYTDKSIQIKEQKDGNNLFKILTSSIKVLSAEETLKEIEFLNKKMAYIRFGDGELQMMEGWEGYKGNNYNCDKLQDELLEAFQITDEDYKIGIIYPYKDKKEREIFRNGNYDYIGAILDNSKRDKYLDSVALHYLSIVKPDIIKEFIKKLNKKRIMLVGGEHLKEVNKFLDIKYFVETPTTQSYYKIDEFYPEIIKNIKDIDIIVLGTGICSKVIQKRIWNEGHNVTTLDLGSFLDSLLGIKSRQWINSKKDI